MSFTIDVPADPEGRRITSPPARGDSTANSSPLDYASSPAAAAPFRRRIIRPALALALLLVAYAVRYIAAGKIDRDMLNFPVLLGVVACACEMGSIVGVTSLIVALLLEWWLPMTIVQVYTPDTSHELARIMSLVLLSSEGMLLNILAARIRRVGARARAGDVVRLRLEQQILEIGDDERRRIGHDLHDGLGQHLTGIALLSESTAQQIEAGGKPDPEQIETITRLVSEAVSWTRDLARSLSPVTLEHEGLLPALEELASNASTLFNIDCVCDHDGPDVTAELHRAQHVYRIVQEAISNAVRHGKAKRVTINSISSADATRLTVTVEDNGSGLSARTIANPGLGLRIMQSRARMADAEVNVRRASPTGGTIVTCACGVSPLPQTSAPDHAGRSQPPEAPPASPASAGA